MDSSLLLNVAMSVGSMVLAAGVTYGAIRSDLRNMNRRLDLLEKIVLQPLTKGA